MRDFLNDLAKRQKQVTDLQNAIKSDFREKALSLNMNTLELSISDELEEYLNGFGISCTEHRIINYRAVDNESTMNFTLYGTNKVIKCEFDILGKSEFTHSVVDTIIKKQSAALKAMNTENGEIVKDKAAIESEIKRLVLRLIKENDPKKITKIQSDIQKLQSCL